MKILGLGGNLGDRAELLREAVRRIAAIPACEIDQVSPYYESEAMLLPDADPSWNIPYFNCAVAISTTLTPHEMLREAKRIEAEMGRHFGARWSPRPIDIDILLWDELKLSSPELNIPHIGLLERPFALLPLSDLYDSREHLGSETARSWRTGKAPFDTRIRGNLYPKWVGILNLTPDSFSDGGLYQNRESIMKHVDELIKDGAAVIDVGAESTRPDAEPITADIEWQRLEGYLPDICRYAHQKNVLVSLDTYRAVTAQRGIDAGVDWINDPSGLTDLQMLDTISNSSVKYVLTHSLSVPVRSDLNIPESADPLTVVTAFAEEKIELIQTKGISKEQLIFDPGIGFGKNKAQCLDLIERANKLKSLGVPILIGHSRKRFLNKSGHDSLDELDKSTNDISKELIRKGIEYLRVHKITAF